MYLQAAPGGQQSYERGHFARQMVDFVSVLSGVVLAAKQGVVGEGLILQDLYALAAAGVVFGSLGDAKQLSNLILHKKIKSAFNIITQVDRQTQQLSLA